MGANFAKVQNNKITSIEFKNTMADPNLKASGGLGQNTQNLIDYINNNGDVTIANIDINAYKKKCETMWNILKLNNIINLESTASTEKTKLNDLNPQIVFSDINKINKTIQSTIGIPTLSYIYFLNSIDDINIISIVIPNIIFKKNESEYFSTLLKYTGPNNDSKIIPGGNNLTKVIEYLNSFYSNLSGNIEVKVLNLLNIIIEYSIFIPFSTFINKLSLFTHIQDYIPTLLGIYLNDFPDDVCIFNKNNILTLNPIMSCPTNSIIPCPANSNIYYYIGLANGTIVFLIIVIIICIIIIVRKK